MSPAANQATLSVVRTLLGMLVVWLIDRGYVSADAKGELIASLMILVPVAWGALDKVWAERRAKARETTAVQAGALAAQTGELGVTPTAIGPVHAQTIIQNMKDQL